MDETSQKIIDATMTLIRDKGYVATTTKDIAKLAGVNECTLFRKFGSKKDIALTGIGQEKWRGNISRDIFQDVVWELQPDLEMFMRAYMERITPDFVNLSIGLRAPQLYEGPLYYEGPAGLFIRPDRIFPGNAQERKASFPGLPQPVHDDFFRHLWFYFFKGIL